MGSLDIESLYIQKANCRLLQALVEKKGAAAERELLKYLSDVLTTLTVMTTVKLLSGHADDEQYLDEANDNFTVSLCVMACFLSEVTSFMRLQGSCSCCWQCAQRQWQHANRPCDVV
eukprot:GHUV01042302.1.p2 GENE.GHUV01042302.1~~GHUV01042302.1.p2  ORF type:complete len:117 (-),score=39.91 GHUV01042302.1:741-1091(-)